MTSVGFLVGIRYTGVSVMLGIALLTLWVLFGGNGIRDLPSRAILTLTGYFRGRPDPWLEGALRTAFAEFDRELAVIMQDRSRPIRIMTDPAARRAVIGESPGQDGPAARTELAAGDRRDRGKRTASQRQRYAVG